MRRRRGPTLALVALVVAFAGEALAAIPAGEVLATKRRVVLERQDQQIPATPTMTLLEKDGIATDARARAKLYFRDDSILNLGELSRVSVDEYLFNTDADRSRSIYRLIEGTLKVVVGRSDLEIHTPTAVAAARGTAFIVTVRECTPQEMAGHDTKASRCTVTTIVVLEGEVETRNIVDRVGGKVTLSKGQTTRVFSSAAPEPAATVAVDRLADLASSLTVMGQLPGERLPQLAGGEVAQVGERVTVKASGEKEGPAAGANAIWRIASAPPGSTAEVADPAAPLPTFVPDLPGEYVLERVDASGSGEVITHTTLMALDSVGEMARVGERVTVNTSGFQTQPGSDTHAVWRIASAPPGSTAQVVDVAAPRPTFVPDLPGEYVLERVDASGSGGVITQATVVTLDEALPDMETSGLYEPPETFLEEPEVLLDEIQDIAVPVPTQEPAEEVTPVVIRIDLP